MQVGDTFQLNFKVNESVYNGFIEIFKDKNPLHVDDSFAQQKGFSSKVMQGNILNGFLSYFIGEGLPLKNVMILSQQINYSNPVYLNDQLQLTAEIVNLVESVNIFEIKYYFMNQQNKKVARGIIQIKTI